MTEVLENNKTYARDGDSIVVTQTIIEKYDIDEYHSVMQTLERNLEAANKNIEIISGEIESFKQADGIAKEIDKERQSEIDEFVKNNQPKDDGTTKEENKDNS